MKWLLLLLLAIAPIHDVAWREAQTVRVGWSTPGVVTCLYLEGKPLAVPCAEATTVLVGFSGVDVEVKPGMVLELKSGHAVIQSSPIPPNPYPQPLTLETGVITWQAPSGNDGCVIADGLLLAPCAPSGSAAVVVPSNTRISLRVNTVEVARVFAPPVYVQYLPLVTR